MGERPEQATTKDQSAHKKELNLISQQGNTINHP